MARPAFALSCALALLATGTFPVAGKASADEGRVLADHIDTLIKTGDFEEAGRQIAMVQLSGDDALSANELSFLEAKLDFAEGQTDEAADRLEVLIAQDADNWRLRWELAQMMIAARADRRAERQLRAILRLDVPSHVQAAVRRDLRAIDARRIVRVSFRASAAPSTNVNQATRATTVDLFGGAITAPLNDEARATSGVGVSWGLRGALTPQVGSRMQGLVSADGSYTDYANRNFDQGTFRLEAGLRRSLKTPTPTQVQVALSGTRRTFAGEGLSSSAGLRLSAQRQVLPRVIAGLQASAEQVEWDERPDRDGPVFAIATNAAIAVTRTAVIRFGINLLREEAEAETLANTQIGVAPGVTVEAPYKVQVTLDPALTFRNFDAATALFGVKREDTTYDVGIGLAKTDFDIRGLRPTLRYQYTVNDSNIEFFDYDRHAFDLGLVRAF